MVSKAEEISNFIQSYLSKEGLECISADDAGELLNTEGILEYWDAKQPGERLRRFLREGQILGGTEFRAGRQTRWICRYSSGMEPISTVKGRG